MSVLFSNCQLYSSIGPVLKPWSYITVNGVPSPSQTLSMIITAEGFSNIVTSTLSVFEHPFISIIVKVAVYCPGDGYSC